MIVYGDPSFEESLSTLVKRLSESQAACAPNSSLDETRSLLVLAGQTEQAVHDAGWDREVVTLCEAVTDRAAEAFVARRLGLAGRAIGALVCALDRLPADDSGLTVKVPEGFAFYSLYPEAYCDSALRWIADHPAGHVLVVGVRSIGTTLSAVVAATLRAHGRRVDRITVRPTGHPFSREATLEAAPADWVLVVDEGPGISGSSMAAVAEAAHRLGVAKDRIAFFPGHGGEPGERASECVRSWWASTPRYVTPTDALRWDGRSLVEALAHRTSELHGGQSVARIEDFGGGLWRAGVYDEPSQWPAVAVSFERAKYRVTLADGRAVLWKFDGFHSAATLGFVALPWVGGHPLASGDASPALLPLIGQTIATAAGPPLPAPEATRARERLAEMLYWNTREALDEAAAKRAKAIFEGADCDPDLPSYGDGRMAPHEWIRTSSGSVAKVDTFGHDRDHTIVGRQPVVWDVAGAMVEWGLNETEAAPLLRTCPHVSADELLAYRIAYAAFRMGQCTLCASMTAEDTGEPARLRQAAEVYRRQLAALISAPRDTGRSPV